MELNQNKDNYILTEQEKRALIWRIERYKQKDLNYLPLNYKISQEMEDILTFVEDLANGARELQQSITIAAIQEVDTIEKRTTVKLQKQEKERYAKGGVAKGEKNKSFKEFILKEYNENNHYKTIKEFVNNIVDRLHQGEFNDLKPS
ncbi:hypothetical protein IJ750_06550, partial [bacterium]|nr:hypothetical protein [Alphaproteobacteria bacterium]MBR1776711.1 hypothetical protein [bacterium]